MIYDPKWGYTFDGHRVWIEWWVADALKSVYTTDPTPKTPTSPAIGPRTKEQP